MTATKHAAGMKPENAMTIERALSELCDFLLDSVAPIGPMRSRADYPPQLERALLALRSLPDEGETKAVASEGNAQTWLNESTYDKRDAEWFRWWLPHAAKETGLSEKRIMDGLRSCRFGGQLFNANLLKGGGAVAETGGLPESEHVTTGAAHPTSRSTIAHAPPVEGAAGEPTKYHLRRHDGLYGLFVTETDYDTLAAEVSRLRGEVEGLHKDNNEAWKTVKELSDDRDPLLADNAKLEQRAITAERQLSGRVVPEELVDALVEAACKASCADMQTMREMRKCANAIVRYKDSSPPPRNPRLRDLAALRGRGPDGRSDSR